MAANTTQRKESPAIREQYLRKNDLLNKKHLFGTEYVDSCLCCASLGNKPEFLAGRGRATDQKPEKGRRQAIPSLAARAQPARSALCGFPILCKPRSAYLTDGCSPQEGLLDQRVPTFFTSWHTQQYSIWGACSSRGVWPPQACPAALMAKGNQYLSTSVRKVCVRLSKPRLCKM